MAEMERHSLRTADVSPRPSAAMSEEKRLPLQASKLFTLRMYEVHKNQPQLFEDKRTVTKLRQSLKEVKLFSTCYKISRCCKVV